MRFSKKIVVLVVVLNIIFTIAVLAVSWHTMQSLDSLVVGWFAFTSTEMWSLSKIEREKVGRNSDGEHSETSE